MDITKELFDFLWSCPHREMRGIAAGSGSDYIFEVKKSDLDKFEKLYIKAARGSRDDLEDDELPLECVTWNPNECGDGAGWTNKAYDRQYPGYDFDGFYEPGPKVHIDCEKHLTFRSKLWYYDGFLKRPCCSDPQPLLNRSYVVCIMNDSNEQDIQITTKD